MTESELLESVLQLVSLILLLSRKHFYPLHGRKAYRLNHIQPPCSWWIFRLADRRHTVF